MRKLFSFSQRKLPLLLVLIVGLVPLLWFKNNLLIAGGDLPIPLDPTGNFVRSFLYFWYPYLYGGEPNPQIFAILPWFGFWSLLKFFGFSLLAINKLWFIFDFTLSGVSMYYLVSVVFKKANPILLFVAPLFYMFNVYVMVVTPTMATPLLYGVLPLILGLYIRGLDRSVSSTKYAVLIALSSLLICSVAGNPPIYAILGIMILSYLVYHLVVQGKSQILYSLVFTFKIGIFYFFLNLWWLCPYFINTLVNSTEIIKFSNPGFNFGKSLLSDTFRLFGSWAFHAETDGTPYFPFAHYYKNPFFIIVTFLIPIIAFASVFFKFNKKILYFLPMAALGILLASGSYLGINRLLFPLIPGFWIFREPFAKFTAITALSFAILIGFSTSNFFVFIKRRKGKSLARFYLIGVVSVILISSWPILTGDLIFSQRGWMKSSHVEIPEYWFKTGNWFNNQRGDFRILVLPENPASFYAGLHYKWGYASSDVTPYLVHQPLIEEHPGFGVSGLVNLSTNPTNVLYDKISNFEEDNFFNIKKILQILNVKYILQRNDVDWELVPNHPYLFSPTYLQQVLSSQKYLSKDKSLGGLDFYRISEESFLPHFYVPKNIIYSNGNLEDISNIISFGDLNIRSAIFFPSLIENNDSQKSISKVGVELKNPIEKAGDIFVRAEIDNPIAKDEISEWNGKFTEETSFPYVRWQPGNPQYYFILKKEEFDKWRSRGDLDKLFGKQLLYTAKRVSEIEKWKNQMTDEERKAILMTYERETDKAFDIVEKKIANKESVFLSLRKMERFLMDSRKKIEEVFGESQMVETVFAGLKVKLGQLKPKRDFLNVKYNINLSKAGDYEIFLKKLDNEKLKNWEVLGEKTGTESSKLNNDGWIELGERNFKEGKHQIVLNLKASDNLIEDDWRNFGTNWLGNDKLIFTLQNFFSTDLLIVQEVKNGKNQILIPNGSSLENGLIFQEIKKYRPNSLYRISFDYLIEYGNAKLFVVQDSDINKKTGKITPLVEKELPKITYGQWENMDLLIRSEAGVKAATIYLFAYPEGKTIAHVEFKNMRVEEVFEPIMILRTKSKETAENQIPKIAFTKINPAKYRIEVEGAKNPYILVFSESFNKGWKAYVNKIQNSKFKVQSEDGEIIASYFNGDIKEGTHGMTFLEPATFETWDKKPIPEERHSLVNSYANSWYITPEDTNGKQDYEIIIEFWPQRLFYLGLAVSLITLFSGLIYLGYSLFKKRSKV